MSTVDYYYLKADHQNTWELVSQEQFIAAEQAAGFQSKFGPHHVATAGFSGRGVSGKVVSVSITADGKPAFNMPPLITCPDCSLPYYQTSAPHVCAGGMKGAEPMRSIKEVAEQIARQSYRVNSNEFTVARDIVNERNDSR